MGHLEAGMFVLRNYTGAIPHAADKLPMTTRCYSPLLGLCDPWVESESGQPTIQPVMCDSANGSCPKCREGINFSNVHSQFCCSTKWTREPAKPDAAAGHGAMAHA